MGDDGTALNIRYDDVSQWFVVDELDNVGETVARYSITHNEVVELFKIFRDK